MKINFYTAKTQTFKSNHISKQDEQLLNECRNGNLQAKQKLVQQYTPLVSKIASYFTRKTFSHFSYEDLKQVGMIGLLQGFKTYDKSHETNFIHFLHRCVKNEIFWTIQDGNTNIRYPSSVYRARNKIKDLMNNFYQEHQRFPEYSEIKHLADITEKMYTNILFSYNKKEISISSPILSTDDLCFEDTFSSDKNTEKEASDIIFKEEMAKIIKEALTKREEEIIKLRFGFNGNDEKTLQEIGKILGLTRERIRQIEARALNKIKNKITNINSGEI